MLKLAIPQNSKKGDVTFFKTGIRFSHNFIQREKLTEAQYIWIFVDKPYIAFAFFSSPRLNSIKLINSSKNTLGKTASCAYLKQYKWIASVMEDKKVSSRKFTMQQTSEETDLGIPINYKITLDENYEDIPF